MFGSAFMNLKRFGVKLYTFRVATRRGFAPAALTDNPRGHEGQYQSTLRTTQRKKVAQITPLAPSLSVSQSG